MHRYLWPLLALYLTPFAVAANLQVMEKDLAVLLPAAAADRVLAEAPWFEETWLQRVQEGFAQTSVGDAVQEESHRQDWQLVAVRIAPCQPLLPYISARNSQLCTPEVRLVWQPIAPSYRGNLKSYYADDRAIHVLYEVDHYRLLGQEQGRTYTTMRQRAAQLTASEVQTFHELSLRQIQGILHDVLQLRTGDTPLDYAGIGERPEFQNTHQRTRFVRRLQQFLSIYAKPHLLKELTAFSLPHGRQPPLLDEWVFLAFAPQGAGLDLSSKNIAVRSRQDGRVLLELTGDNTGSMRRDDARVYDALAGLGGRDAKELSQGVLLYANESKAKKEEIADADKTQVPHTTCVSCHKLNDLAFDFHSLSYLEDRAMSISPRVERDVARELAWLAKVLH